MWTIMWIPVAAERKDAMSLARTAAAQLRKWRFPLAGVLTAAAVLTGMGAAGAAGITGTAGSDGTTASAATKARHCANRSGRRAKLRCARAGELVDITLDQLHPTQAVLGY